MILEYVSKLLLMLFIALIAIWAFELVIHAARSAWRRWRGTPLKPLPDPTHVRYWVVFMHVCTAFLLTISIAAIFAVGVMAAFGDDGEYTFFVGIFFGWLVFLLFLQWAGPLTDLRDELVLRFGRNRVRRRFLRAVGKR